MMTTLYIFDLDVILQRNGRPMIGIAEMMEALHSCGHFVNVVGTPSVDEGWKMLGQVGLDRYVKTYFNRDTVYAGLTNDVGFGSFQNGLNARLSFKAM